MTALYRATTHPALAAESYTTSLDVTDHHVTLTELREFLGDKVARWWVPERWTFVDQLPCTSTGKYDKKLLRSAHRQGLLDVAEPV
jgi:acyl-CoA synthetase (AMP-forming)/AMP-acid ligase II